MKNILLLLIGLLSSVNLEAQAGRKITILHTNDLHSRLMGFSPESAYTPLKINDDNTTGGFARIAAIIKSESEGDKGATIVLDAGDFMMGTLFPSLEVKTGFQLRLMKEMGYDVICTGNHEYEFGPEWLANVIGTSVKNGKIPSLLIGNARFDKNDKRDDSLEKLLSDSLVFRKQIIVKEGIRVGIFSILGKDAISVAPKSAPVTFENQISYAKKMVKDLKADKCEIIICLSHSGVTKEENGEWGGEDVAIAKKVKGIDIIIGGHTHTRLDQPLTVNNTTIVQAAEFGKYVGCLSVLYSSGKLKVENYKLIAVNDNRAGDEHINNLIEEQKKSIDNDILKPLGISYNQSVAETDFRLEGNDIGDYMNSNLGPFIADAIHFYVNKHSVSGSDISMVAAGMIFDNISSGIQTAADIFRVMPLGSGNDNVAGYALSRLYVTGKELKSILEILQVASKSKPSNYCYYSGMRVNFDAGGGLFRKIKMIEIVRPDGTMADVDFSGKNKSLYSITADSYMLEFIGIIKKMSFGLINVTPKDGSGNKITDMSKAVIDMDEKREGIQEGKEWLALIEFLTSMKDTDGDGIADIDRKYASPVRSFFPVVAR